MPKAKELKEKRNAASPPGKAPEYDYPSDVYESERNGDGYPKHEIDWDSFYQELTDLLGRYGGVDYQSFRLRAHITDINEHYHHNFLEVPRVTEKTTLSQDRRSLDKAAANVNAATEQLRWVLTDMQHLRKVSKGDV